MESKDYLKDITEIKDLMNRSSRFISLSGLSGILAGVYAIIGGLIIHSIISRTPEGYASISGVHLRHCSVILSAVAILSIITGIILTTKKAEKHGSKIWDSTSRRLILNFLIPLLTGGAYILIILGTIGHGQIASLMLIFYGLALINASKYSLGGIRYLGLTEVFFGLLCALLPSYGIWFWLTGFGVLHIVYGSVMYFKYEK
ncbi:MAG TPA: hypothetical protein VKZ97_00370 [Flavobacteriaceae bacterium]|nr:hypothetical protein [Flavobacteriaceae bacterium]